MKNKYRENDDTFLYSCGVCAFVWLWRPAIEQWGVVRDILLCIDQTKPVEWCQAAVGFGVGSEHLLPDRIALWPPWWMLYKQLIATLFTIRSKSPVLRSTILAVYYKGLYRCI